MDNIIKLEITTTIQIDLADLVDKTGLEAQSTVDDIENTIKDYIEGLDDIEFFKEINIVAERVREYLDGMSNEN